MAHYVLLKKTHSIHACKVHVSMLNWPKTSNKYVYMYTNLASELLEAARYIHLTVHALNTHRYLPQYYNIYTHCCFYIISALCKFMQITPVSSAPTSSSSSPSGDSASSSFLNSANSVIMRIIKS